MKFFWGLIFLSLFTTMPAFAKAVSKIITVKVESAYIYQEANFDAPIIADAKLGDQFIAVSKLTPFLKIKLKSGGYGYISDVDVQFGKVKLAEKKKQKLIAAPKKKRKPFADSRYRGPVVQYTQFTENTMGKERLDNLLFFGAKFSGYNTLIEGDVFVDSNILFFSGAPKYYNDVTGQSARGWVFMGDILFETALPQSRWHYVYYGFGPVFKFSHFEVALKNGNIVTSYSMDDMSLGAALNAGIAFRMNRYALRSDVKYIWEKTKYLAFGLSFQFDF